MLLFYGSDVAHLRLSEYYGIKTVSPLLSSSDCLNIYLTVGVILSTVINSNGGGVVIRMSRN